MPDDFLDRERADVEREIRIRRTIIDGIALGGPFDQADRETEKKLKCEADNHRIIIMSLNEKRDIILRSMFKTAMGFSDWDEGWETLYRIQRDEM